MSLVLCGESDDLLDTRDITRKRSKQWNSDQIHRIDGNHSAIFIFIVFLHDDFVGMLSQSIAYPSRKLTRIHSESTFKSSMMTVRQSWHGTPLHSAAFHDPVENQDLLADVARFF
jgi:hypothetical protein